MQNECSIKARTHFYPFFRLYLAVAVQVGTEVAVPAKAAAGIVFQQ